METAWSEKLVSHPIKPFSGTAGPTVPIPESPLDIWRLLYTSDLIDTIVEESNRYAAEVMGPEKLAKWRPITVRDHEAFLGFTILMGLVSHPSVPDYWKKDSKYHYPPIADKISRDRFREISRYLHYVDNSTLSSRHGTSEYDKLGKVRPLLDHLQRTFASIYNPGQDVAVDEAMIKFQGRSSLKQYMPMKPIKRGIKVWVLADSNNGYFSRLEVYTGKKSTGTELGLGTRVVLDLTKDFQHKWHRVYCDNFFTCKALLCKLEEVGIYGCGTTRSHRKGFPKSLVTKSKQFKSRYIHLSNN